MLHEKATKISRNKQGRSGAAGAFGCAIEKENQKSDREKVKAVASAAGSRARRPRACGFDVVKIHGPRSLNPQPFPRTSRAGAQHREGLKISLHQ